MKHKRRNPTTTSSGWKAFIPIGLIAGLAYLIFKNKGTDGDGGDGDGSTDSLTGLTSPQGQLSPAFDPSVLNYTLHTTSPTCVFSYSCTPDAIMVSVVNTDELPYTHTWRSPDGSPNITPLINLMVGQNHCCLTVSTLTENKLYVVNVMRT